MQDGVEIVRVRTTAFERTRLWLRALNYVTFLLQSLRVGLSGDRPDVVLAMTDPPVIANVALLVARRFRVPLVVVSQDVFPETAVELGRIRQPRRRLALRALVRLYLRRADRIVAIGETMRTRLEAKGARPDRITVIPNWVDTSAIAPAARDNAWARQHGLDGRFVVMHSGNVGHAQDLDSLIRAATLLRDLDDLTVAIIGGGARHAELVALAGSLDASQVRFLPYQPREVLSQSLSAADVHVGRASRAALPATSFRAGCTASSPSAGRSSSRRTPRARSRRSSSAPTAESSSRRGALTSSPPRSGAPMRGNSTSLRWASADVSYWFGGGPLGRPREVPRPARRRAR